MLLRHYLEQGASKSALAQRLGVSRDTIYRWIRTGDLDRDLDAEPVRYSPRPPVPTKLDAYKGIIEARLAAYPQLSAVRLLEEIRAAGYSGGYSQLKAFVRHVRPISTPEPVIRFETPAGRQAQVDFARFRFPWGVRYALLVVLGYLPRRTHVFIETYGPCSLPAAPTCSRHTCIALSGAIRMT